MIRGIFWGLVVVWIGFWIWLGSSVAPQTFAFKVAWPIIFVIIGLLGLVELIQSAIRRSRRGIPFKHVGWRTFWALLLVVVGLAIWFSNIGLIAGFGQWWWALIVVVGIAIIIRVILHRLKRKPRKVTVIIDKLEEGKINVDEAVEEIRCGKSKGNCCHE
ncbi:hypothetical protein CEE36_07215 [candidate division TA06 bacterium B3_TA06]|uniref:DUF5668 domain-containing protein n=1 Tax=candidate division TA06 bacterium B3_TA06 TaxID=2012487 RepID=A0A532V656_UNCT6|nr:MAG: hypothetical protein CEE36_07215 [candidate division TA06 bacterium B3_TA06]